MRPLRSAQAWVAFCQNLKINHIWPQNDTIGDSILYFDDIVVATSRIGCIVPP